jgi:transposase
MSERQRRVFTDEFKREAVSLIASSGRSIRQVADDLGLGLSTLTRWKREQRSVEVAATPNPDLTKELARLRKENELLKQERDLLKKAAAFFAKETSR